MNWDLLHITGHAVKFVDRNLRKRDENSLNSKFNLSLAVFSTSKPNSKQNNNLKTQKEINETSLKVKKIPRKCPIEVDHPRKRRILIRPKRFKTFFSDRKPLSIPSYIFPRFDETNFSRRKERLCTFTEQNEILNEQLLRIKSAQTVKEFEKLLLRNHQEFSLEKFIEPYYDFKDILKDKTCLRTIAEEEEFYRSKSNQLLSDKFNTSLPLTIISSTTSSAVQNLHKEFNEFDLKVDRKDSINSFIRSATDCYENCINCYRNNLDTCNQRAEIAKHQQSDINILERLSLKVRRFDDSTLANQINKISIKS